MPMPKPAQRLTDARAAATTLLQMGGKGILGRKATDGCRQQSLAASRGPVRSSIGPSMVRPPPGVIGVAPGQRIRVRPPPRIGKK